MKIDNTITRNTHKHKDIQCYKKSEIKSIIELPGKLLLSQLKKKKKGGGIMSLKRHPLECKTSSTCDKI